MTAVDSVGRLHSHHEQFEALVRRSRAELDAGRPGSAATYAQIAGQFAWMNHTGRFASPELERLLARIGEELPDPPRARPRTPDPRVVLHVVTQTYQTGGPTQAISCWLEQDTGRRHRVCITRQGSTPPPPKLTSRIAEPGGLIRLDTARGDLLGRAARLRALAGEVDAVLLHTHPYDVIPVIAFAGLRELPPVIYVNHGDHVFWLGTSIAGILLNMRDSGRELAAARRGVDPGRSLVMPRPLMPAHRTLERDEAKRRLGVDPDRVLLVTAADAPKYRPVEPPSFLDLVEPVIERHPEALLIAAGPAPEGEWAEAAARTEGRVRALGRLPTVTDLHQAADVYLDSFPFSSLTSLLEAGSLGTPAVTYRGHPADCGVLGADTRGVDEHMLRPADPDAFGAALDRLIADPGWRRGLGDRMDRAIRETHTGDGWRDGMAAAYAYAAEIDLPDGPGEAPRGTGAVDRLVDQVMARTSLSEGPSGAIRDQLGLLPPSQRLRAGAAVVRAGTPPTVRQVFPEWVLPRLGDCYRFARRLRHATG